jgi:hypothetical protein
VISSTNRGQGARTTSPITGSRINPRAATAGTHNPPGSPVRMVCGSLVRVKKQG